MTMAIFQKEWREIVRDRRSLVSGLLYGVWGPLVMGLALVAMARQYGEIGAITISAQGASGAPSLAAFLESRQARLTDDGNDLAASIRDRRIPVALVVDDEYAGRFEQNRPAKIMLLHDSTWPESARHAAHLRTLLSEYSRSVADTRLVLRGIAPPAITPVRLVERDYATVADRAGRALATMPIFVLLAAFIGGMGVAADLGAGERERGSLESLLLYPVSRSAIVAGKWLAVCAAALATVVLALGVSVAVLAHPRLSQLDVPVGLGLADALFILLMLVPLALAASAVQLLIGCSARTYKEAQTKLSTLIFVPMIPGFLFAFGSIEPARWMTFAPMIGQHMLITDLVRGQAPSVMDAAVLSLLTLAAAAAAGWTAARQLDREGVLRRAGA